MPEKLERKLIVRGYEGKSICACLLNSIADCEDIFKTDITIRHPQRVLLTLGLSTGHHNYLKGAGPEIIPSVKYSSKSYVLRIGTTEIMMYNSFKAAAGSYQVTEEERTQRFRIVPYSPKVIEPQDKPEPYFPERQGLFSTVNYTTPTPVSLDLNANPIWRWVNRIISIEQA
jgi:hypothetical protein